MTLARQLYDIFFSSSAYYAIGGVRASGEVVYTPQEGIPTLAQIEQHLQGEIILGAYTVLPGNWTRWIAFDVDSKNGIENARELTSKISSYLEKIAHTIEFSGNKGYHIFLFFKDAISAKDAKRIGETIRDILGLPKKGDPHVEVFPKQAELNEGTPLGNLLRLPLGIHPSSKKKAYFVDLEREWQETDPEKQLSLRANLDDLEELAKEEEPVDQIVNLLAPYWLPSQRHDMALYTSGSLAILGWTEEAVKEVIEGIHAEIGTGDLEDWLRCVRDTFGKVYKGETVIGQQGLADILPSNVLKELVDIATQQVFSAALQIIDRIRLGKGAAWQKVRTASRMIISHFKENGKLIRDTNHTYWLDRRTRDLLKVDGIDWSGFIHNEFGLNPLESFGKQTMESVRLTAKMEAQLLSVFKRSYWDGDRLHMNLGGPEVYVLNGNPSERQIVSNGDNQVLFLNTDDTLCVPNLQEDLSTPMDPWAFLVDDLNFATGDKVNATPIQQRELIKAWVVSIFFAQALPTRPILTLLASTGAGKSTTARRILRFVEGTQEDVLGVVPDKPDSLRSSIASHKVLVLDNLEKSKATWLTDVLNRISTGSHIELRVLHTTNDVRRIVPDCYVIITATEMPFSEETVFTRMLPIQLAPLKLSKPEYQIQTELVDNFNALWKGLLNDLDKVVAELKANKDVVAPSESRLADFTVFCARIQNADFLNGRELMSGLSDLVSRQKNVLSQNSPFMDALDIYVRTRGEETGKWMSMSELYTILQRIANANRIEWRWGNSQGLSRHVSMLEPNLIKFYGMSISTVRENGREVKKYKFDKVLLN